MLVASIICYNLAVICWAGMDTIAHRYWNSIFVHFPTPKNRSYFWTAKISWAYKYKSWRLNLKGDPEILDYSPRFPGSKTWLIWLTDGWHLLKMLILIFLLLSFYFFPEKVRWEHAVFAAVNYFAVFEAFYGYLLKKKK